MRTILVFLGRLSVTVIVSMPFWIILVLRVVAVSVASSWWMGMVEELSKPNGNWIMATTRVCMPLNRLRRLNRIHDEERTARFQEGT